MKKIKSENGAITIVVLVSILFMVSFLISSYILVSNKVKSQKEMIAETKNIYETTSTMEEIYNSYFIKNEIIPIFNVNQLLKIATGENINVNGKIYSFSNEETYLLMNDLVLKEEEWQEILQGNEWEPIRRDLNFQGEFDYNNHTITVIRLSGSTDVFDGSKTVLADYRLTEDNIGDYINYNCLDGVTEKLEYTVAAEKIGNTTENEGDGADAVFTVVENVKWKILGIDNGKLLIIAEEPTSTRLTLSGKEGYASALNELNKVAGLYGHGTYAYTTNYTYDYDGQTKTSAGRSITIEDVNNLTAYDPTKDDDFKDIYGSEYTYSKESDSYIYINGTKSENTVFVYYNEESEEWETLLEEESKTLIDTYYYYEITDEKAKGILSGDFWLASKSINCRNEEARYYIRYVKDNVANRDRLCESNDEYRFTVDRSIYPVVVLQPNIDLTWSEEKNEWQISK